MSKETKVSVDYALGLISKYLNSIPDVKKDPNLKRAKKALNLLKKKTKSAIGECALWTCNTRAIEDPPTG